MILCRITFLPRPVNEAQASAYPYILMTGARIYPFYHSAWTQIPMQREIEPDPFIEIHPDAAKEKIDDGDWLFVESPNGRIRAKARLTKCIDARCIHFLVLAGGMHARNWV